MPAVHDRISKPTLGRLQLRMRGVLRSAGAEYATGQAAGRRDAGRHSPAPISAVTIGRTVLRQPDADETPLSWAEIQHGKRIGVIA